MGVFKVATFEANPFVQKVVHTYFHNPGIVHTINTNWFPTQTGRDARTIYELNRQFPGLQLDTFGDLILLPGGQKAGYFFPVKQNAQVDYNTFARNNWKWQAKPQKILTS